MSRQRKRYDYADELHWCRDYHRTRRILRKLVREAVEGAYLEFDYSDHNSRYEVADRIAKELVP